jgi:hypothetical protein
MALDELLEFESTSHEWSQSCISRNIQIDLPVARHAEIFENVCEGELCAIKEKGRQKTFKLASVRTQPNIREDAVLEVCMW